VAPQIARDKDGVSAALLLAELAASLRARGQTVLDVLDTIAVNHGVYATDAFSVRVADLAQISPVMERLRSTPPRELGGVSVSRVDDLARGDGGLPPTDGVRWFLADDSRVIVRPSGTEPKIKVYLEAVEPVAEAGRLAAARRAAAERLAAMRTAMEPLTGWR
jgi:phosphomannomutase